MKYFVAILESSTYGTWKDTSFSVSSISDAFIQKVTSDDYLLVSFLITSVLEWRARAAGPVLPARWVPYSLSETVGLVAALAASRDLSKWHFSTGGVKSNFSPGPLTSFSHRRLQFSSHSSLYTNLSGRRGETHISLCLNHRVSLGKINQGTTAPLPQLCERRDQTAQARLGDVNKRRADARPSPSCTSSGANLLSLVMLEDLLAAWICVHLNF